MEATLCNRTPYPSIKKLQCLLTIEGRNSTLRHSHNLTLTFSPPFESGLRARPSHKLNTVIWAQMPPPLEDDSSNRKVDGGQNRPRGAAVRSAAAAVVLACALGAISTSWKGMACTPSVPGSTQPTEKAPEKCIQENSFRGSQEILFELLRKHFNTRKKYLPVPNTCEKGDAATNFLFNELAKSKISQDTYDLGLLLIDILLNQGDYERANFVCQKIEIDAPRTDVRPLIRRVIIDLMLLREVIESEAKETEKKNRLTTETEKKMLKLIELITARDNAPTSAKLPQLTP